MGFLGLGKKKSKNDTSNALETLPNMAPSDANPPSVPNISTSPIVESVSAPESLTSVPVSIPEVDSPENASLHNVPVENPEAPISSEPDTELNLPENPDESSFDALPDFSEDDFSAPPPPTPTSSESLKPKEEVKKEISDSQTSLFAPAKKEVKLMPSFSGSSYADSQGVFVSRAAYISLLNSLKESSKNISSLSDRQKHLIDFDNSMKKLFDTESSSFEKLHKDILAIMPFVSKK